MERQRVILKGLTARVLEPGSPEQVRLAELDKIIADLRVPLDQRNRAIEEAWPLRFGDGMNPTG